MMRSLLLLVAVLHESSCWVLGPVPCDAGVRRSAECAAAASAAVCRALQPARAAAICMQEDGVAEAAPAEVVAEADDAVSDFTEDLLEALTTDDESMEEAEPVYYKAEEGIELSALPSYDNAQSVEVMRSRYQLHDKDTGSAQVQVAVLTARIAYMTKHMQSNKKDYASLRGLTAMVTRRRKLLEYLLSTDVSEFKRLTSDLGIRTNQLLKPKLGGARGRRV